MPGFARPQRRVREGTGAEVASMRSPGAALRDPQLEALSGSCRREWPEFTACSTLTGFGAPRAGSGA
jgi:hypothetical protein